jgi:hypothetical protein
MATLSGSSRAGRRRTSTRVTPSPTPRASRWRCRRRWGRRPSGASSSGRSSACADGVPRLLRRPLDPAADALGRTSLGSDAPGDRLALAAPARDARRALDGALGGRPHLHRLGPDRRGAATLRPSELRARAADPRGQGARRGAGAHGSPSSPRSHPPRARRGGAPGPRWCPRCGGRGGSWSRLWRRGSWPSSIGVFRTFGFSLPASPGALPLVPSAAPRPCPRAPPPTRPPGGAGLTEGRGPWTVA